MNSEKFEALKTKIEEDTKVPTGFIRLYHEKERARAFRVSDNDLL